MVFFVLLLCGFVYAQEFNLDQFNSNRNGLNTKAMLTLGGWAVANIAANSVLYANASKGDRKYFYQMNAAWNVVNLAIAGFGYYGALNPDTTLSLYESMREQSNIENILLFNAGLDVSYMMTGLYLIEKSKNSEKHKNRYKGYGQSLILQGGFLFIFDSVVFYLQNQNHKMAADLFSNIYIHSQGVGLTINF